MINNIYDRISFLVMTSFCLAVVLVLLAVYTERDLSNSVFGQSRFEVAEKIKQCEADLARNQRCKVIVTVEKP